MPSPVVEALAALRDAFGRLGARWYLFGAQAALLYGAARLTADADVTVDPGPHATRELLAVLTGGGFEARVPDPEGFAERTRVLPLLHTASGMPVDVVLAGPGLEAAILARARILTLEGIPIPVASPEDLVTMKVLAGRPKDLDDAEAIVAANAGTLDETLVRTTLATLERALDRSDLVPAFDALAARARS